jgi:hypothetical protein
MSAWEAIGAALAVCRQAGHEPEEILLSLPLLAALQGDTVAQGRLTATTLFGVPYVVQAQHTPRVVARTTWFPIEWTAAPGDRVSLASNTGR